MKTLLLLAAIIAPGCLFATESKKITLRADVWCPYNCDPKGKQNGYMIDLAKAAFSEKGYEVNYETLAWARAILETREGKHTAIVGAAKKDSPYFVFPQLAIGSSKNCFYTKKDNQWEFKNLQSLDKVRLGVVKDYSYHEDIDSYIVKNIKNSKKIDVVSGDNPLELNVKKLEAGRIDAFVEDDLVLANYFFARKQEVPFRLAGCSGYTDLFVAFSPKNANAAELAKILTDKLVAVRADGSFQKLLDQYGIKDWVEKSN